MKNKIKILFVFNNLDVVNGISHYCKPILEYLSSSNDFELFILCGRFPEMKLKINNSCLMIDETINYDKRNIYNFIKIFFNFNNLLKKYNIDIVQTHHFYHSFIFKYLKLIHRIKVFQTIHGLIPNKGILPHFSADFYFVVSKHSYEYLKTKLINIKIIHYYFKRFKAKQNHSNNNIKFLISSRLCKEKGFEVLFDAIEILKNQKLYFDISIAGNGDMEDFVKSKCKKYKLNFLGQVNDIENIIPKFDVLINPIIGENEGVPTILIQAALNKLLIISSNYFGHEFYLNKNNSLIYNKANPRELAENIIYVSKNFHKLNKIRKNIYTDFRKEFYNKLNFESQFTIYKSFFNE